MQKATIKKVEPVKSKKGARAVKITVMINDDPKNYPFPTDWINESASPLEVERWWVAAGCTPLAWSDFVSMSAYDLLGAQVMVSWKPSDDGTFKNIDGVRALDTGVEDPAPVAEDTEPEEDEIPF